jgi:hypothetical protein
MSGDQTTLEEILSDMDVPAARTRDHRWLSRNLHVLNSGHPRFREACGLLQTLLRQT